MDKIISLYERERIDASAFHGVNGTTANINTVITTTYYYYNNNC